MAESFIKSGLFKSPSVTNIRFDFRAEDLTNNNILIKEDDIVIQNIDITEPVILITTLSKKLKIDRSSLLKSIKKSGIQPYRIRCLETGWQSATALTQKQVNELIKFRNSKGIIINNEN